MFTQEILEEIKRANELMIHHDGALLHGTPLKDHNYEIIALEEVTDQYLVYKAINLSNGEFVCLKEYFPKKALGYKEEIYIERNFETLALELKNRNLQVVEDYKTLMAEFVEENKYKEKLVIHPPLVKIRDVFYDYGTVYLVLDYNRWPTLKEVIDSPYSLDFKTLDTWIKNIINQIIPFHKRGIVHRNLNPKNIYIHDSGLLVNGLGTCEFLKDIKIYNADDYSSRYYAPEINMDHGEIGLYSDVYAIGKIMIDLLIKMSVTSDYFKALDQIPKNSIRDQYESTIKRAIAFKHTNRIDDAMTLKKALYQDRNSENFYTPPKQIIAMIAAMAVISSMLVLWQYSAPDNYADDPYIILEDEPVPLGAVEGLSELSFLTPEGAVLTRDNSKVHWLNSKDVTMSKFKLFKEDIMFLEGNLEDSQVTLDLFEHNLESGDYSLEIGCIYEGRNYFLKLNFKILK
jgi:serine/threonine protein kinase